MKRWWVLAAAFISGAAALFVLFPRWDLSSRAFQLSLDRATVEQVLQREAIRHGIDISGWKKSAGIQLVERANDARAAFPDSPVVKMFSGVRVRTEAISLKGERVEATFLADGRPESFLSHASTVALRPAAELRHYTGDSASQFRQVTRGAMGREGTLFTWEWMDPSHEGTLARFETLQYRDKSIRSSNTLNLSDEIAEAVRIRNHRASLDTLATTGSFLSIAGITVACWAFFRSLTRRTDHLRFPIRFVLVLAAVSVVPFFTGAKQGVSEMASPDARGAFSTGMLGALIWMVFATLLMYVFLAAGFAVLPESERPAWAGLRLISTGRWFSRRIGQELVAGLLSAVPLLGILFVTAAITSRTARLYGVEYLLQPVPALSPMEGVLNQLDVAGLFAVVLPVCLRYIRIPRLPWLIAGGLGMLFLASVRRPFETDIPIELAAGALLFAGFALIYRFFGLLATLTAGAAMIAVHHGLSFGVQPNASLVKSGGEIGGIYLIVTLGSAILAWWGRPHDQASLLEDMAPAESDVSRSERDRQQAELAVARRAQQNVLPAAPPAVPGLDVAAICRPAREVGGDLFEFPKLADGRRGFCVADVSGKGVPAALYMTLTTGILAAAARRSNEIHEVVSQLNRHLYTACKHRTFVTLSLGAWDYETRQFQHVRAGHNPVLHCPAAGPSTFLQPSGLGLGLVRSTSFDKKLECHEVALAEGDVLVLYSDGLVEAMNKSLDQFGEERLKEVVERNRSADAASIQAKILESVDSFTAGADPHDDLTVMVLVARG